MKVIVQKGLRGAKALKIIEKHCKAILADYGPSVLARIGEEDLKWFSEHDYQYREIPETPILELGVCTVDTSHKKIPMVAKSSIQPSGRSHHLVRLAGPLHGDWKTELEQKGVRFYEAVADDAYLVSADRARIDEISDAAYVEAVVGYDAQLKINPALLSKPVIKSLKSAAGITISAKKAAAVARPVKKEISTVRRSKAKKTPDLELVLFDATDQIETADAVRAAGATPIKVAGDRLIVKAKSSAIAKLAEIGSVREVNPHAAPELHNNVATGIINADVLHNDHGLDGSGQVIAVGDTGLDNGVNDATMLDDFQGRIDAIFALGRPGDASDPDGHGTHVAGSVLSDGSNSNNNVRGLAPGARLVFQSLLDASGGLGGIPANLGVGLFDVARNNGAVIHTNSWGADVNGAYNGNSNEADTFAFNNRNFLIVFSAGNDSPNRIGAPGTAKNVLTVGASESVRAVPATVNFPASPEFPGGANITNFDQGADDQNQVAGFSSLGPAQNNRQKPDVVAPGSWILSARSSVSVYDAGPDGLGAGEFPPVGTGDEDGIPTHAEAVGLGLPGQPVFGGGDANTPGLPAGSGAGAAQDYMYLSGTSMATPITAGTCALVRQYLIEQRGHTPSAALIKAIMVNGAVDMGMGIPDNGQGWGRIDLTNSLFPPDSNRVQFDDSLSSAVASGEIQTYDVFVSSVAQPLVVTLVWRDPGGAAIQNRLHLRVTHVGTGVTTTADPIGNIRNNVQKVVIDPPGLGAYQIEVEGVSVVTAIPEHSPTLRQDYALVIAGATGFSCNPSDIVQVIDRSGSMGFFGYMEPAKTRAQQLIDILQINDRVGVVTFNQSANEPLALTQVNSQAVKDAAKAVVSPLTSTGNTDLREALEQGVTTLGPDIGQPRSIIFLSDGHHTVASPDIDDLFLDGVAASNVKVYTIGLGPSSDYAVLDNIANRTGTGSVYTVESAADIHKLSEIYYDIIGGLGCGGLVHLDSAPLQIGSSSRKTAIIDSTVSEAHFAVSWLGEKLPLRFELEDPDGNKIDPKTVGVFYFEGANQRFYRLASPKPGRWIIRLKMDETNDVTAPVLTTAVLADSDVKVRASVDRKFLLRGKLLLQARATVAGKPLTRGKAVASVTFPTVTTKQLLRKHAAALKRIKVDRKLLKRAKDDPNLVRLGVLLAQSQAEGKDLLERKTVRVKLTDDGTDGDCRKNDGNYTALVDPAKIGVAGNMDIRVEFSAEARKIGQYRYVGKLPVFAMDSD